MQIRSGDWEYNLLEDGTADITMYSFDKRDATSVEIPETLDGHPVTISSTNPFIRCKLLPAFTVSPNHPTLTTIDGVLFNRAEKKLVAFPRASAVTEYAVPEGVLAVGTLAFFACDSLTSITLPKSVTSLGEVSFHACVSLTEIRVSPDNPAVIIKDGVLFDESGKRLYIFLKSNERIEYTIPDGVVSIASNAFAYCSLTSITLPESVTSIGEAAFFFCGSLTNINLPNSVMSIGNEAFFWCSQLTSITLPDDVTSIGRRMFYECESLASITLPKGLTSIGAEAFFNCASLKSLTLPESVTSIGTFAFAFCFYLESITLPKSAIKIKEGTSHEYFVPTSIGGDMFEQCENLESICVTDNGLKEWYFFKEYDEYE